MKLRYLIPYCVAGLVSYIYQILIIGEAVTLHQQMAVVVPVIAAAMIEYEWLRR